MSQLLMHKKIQQLKEDNRKISPPLEDLIRIKAKILKKSKSEPILKNIKYNKNKNNEFNNT